MVKRRLCLLWITLLLLPLYGGIPSSGFSVSFTKKEQAYLDSHKSIRLSVDSSDYPYEKISSDGSYIGIASDLFTLISSLIGLSPEIVPAQAEKDRIESISSGVCDAMMVFNVASYEEKGLEFTNSFFFEPVSIVTRLGTAPVVDLEMEGGATVAVRRGSGLSQWLTATYPNLLVIIVDSEQEACEYVSSGKAHLAIGSQGVFFSLIKNKEYSSFEITGQVPGISLALRMAVAKDDLLLLSILNKAIDAVSPDVVGSILGKYASKRKILFDYRVLFIYLGILALLVILIVLRVRRLRHLYLKSRKRVASLTEKSRQLASSEELYRSIINTSPDAIIVSDRQGKIIMASPVTAKLVGYPRGQLPLGRALTDFIAPESLDALMVNLDNLFSGMTKGETFEYLGKREDGSIFNLEARSEVLRDSKGAAIQMVSIIRDITEKKHTEGALYKSEEILRQLNEELQRKNLILSESSTKDHLTGIRNRRYFDQKLQEEMAVINQTEGIFSLLLFDLDKFKDVNDTWGHKTGDDVLILTVNTIISLLPDIDWFARWGGEEFVILLPNISLPEATGIAENMRKKVQDIPHPSVGSVTISIGVTQYHRGETAESLFKRVDQALYRAKLNGRNQVSASRDDLENQFVLFQWQPRFVSGQSEIDVQHKILFDLGNDLIEALLKNAGKEQVSLLLVSIKAHVIDHFAYEESYLLHINYPGYAEHKTSHQQLLAKTEDFIRQANGGTIDPYGCLDFLLKELIMQHLLIEDVKYFPFVKGGS